MLEHIEDLIYQGYSLLCTYMFSVNYINSCVVCVLKKGEKEGGREKSKR